MELLPITLSFFVGFGIGFGLRAVTDHFISAESDKHNTTFFEEATSLRAITLFLLFIIGIAWLVTVIATFINPELDIAKIAPVHALMGTLVGFIVKQNTNAKSKKAKRKR